jgi:hypothetical protein
VLSAKLKKKPIGQAHYLVLICKDVIIFKGVARGFLQNGNLLTLAQYFSKLGNHLFSRTVRQLSICNVRLQGYNLGHDQMPDGTRYIGYLIAKNPDINEINLDYTHLGDEEAETLLKSLKTNTKLQKLTLEGNNINQKKI